LCVYEDIRLTKRVYVVNFMTWYCTMFPRSRTDIGRIKSERGVNGHDGKSKGAAHIQEIRVK
jgi:hypothetical protein